MSYYIQKPKNLELMNIKKWTIYIFYIIIFLQDFLKSKKIYIQMTINNVRAWFWFPSPKDKRIQTQRAQHNKFIVSWLKS